MKLSGIFSSEDSDKNSGLKLLLGRALNYGFRSVLVDAENTNYIFFQSQLFPKLPNQIKISFTENSRPFQSSIIVG